MFKWITLNDLELALKDFFEQQAALFATTETGKFYGPKLAKKKQELDALPDAIKGGRPLADELGDADARHDGVGSAIWYFTEAVLRHPFLSEAIKQAALRIRNAFVESLGVLRAPLATEASAAQKNRPLRKDLEAELKMFVMPGAPSTTLDDWVGDFLEAGDEIGMLLRERAATEAAAAGAEKAKVFRTSLISLLVHIRDALGDEVEENQALPRNLDATLFGYFDKLEQMRAEAGAARIATRKAREGTEKK